MILSGGNTDSPKRRKCHSPGSWGMHWLPIKSILNVLSKSQQGFWCVYIIVGWTLQQLTGSQKTANETIEEKDKDRQRCLVFVCESAPVVERKREWVMHFSTVHSCKYLTAADWEYDCVCYAFSWGNPVVFRKLYSPQCQTALTPQALHIRPLVPPAHSALSAPAGSLSGSTNGRAHTNTERVTVNADLIFCPRQGRNNPTEKVDRVPYTVAGESPTKQSSCVWSFSNVIGSWPNKH